jgi:hypothetical protein
MAAAVAQSAPNIPVIVVSSSAHRIEGAALGATVGIASKVL